MSKFDQEDVKLQLEAMKMHQSSLQQLMALSAGGLALYFSFIGKAQFLESVRFLGVLVVISWITSLCAAIIAHRLHASLFLCLYHYSSAALNIEDLKGLPDAVKEKLKTAIAQKAVVDEAKTRIEEERKAFALTARAFEAAFFPIQEKAARLVTVALYSFVLGFVFLGVGYLVWVYSI